MVDLLKAFGRGILYVFAFPFFILALVLFGAYGFFAFLIQLVRSVIYFFTGQKFFPELPEDKELRLQKEGANPQTEDDDEEEEPQQPIKQEEEIIFEEKYDEDDFLEEPVPQKTVIMPNPAPTQTVEEACFQEETKPEPEAEEKPEPEVEESPLADLLNPFEDNEEDEEEVLDVYRPKGSAETFEYEDDNEEDDTNNGVNIKFDD